LKEPRTKIQDPSNESKNKQIEHKKINHFYDSLGESLLFFLAFITSSFFQLFGSCDLGP